MPAFEGRNQSSLTSMTEYSLPTLSSASSQKVTVLKEYKSGASYQGQVKGNRRTGLGVFTWPNGSKYEGEFIDNDRHGKGIQQWPDQSSYVGEFSVNMRHGDGDHKWANGESYIGTFFRDRRHGHGTYTWPDGSKYVGTFYMDKKEGYGTFYFANGNVFEGLYGSDERYGPGVLKYKDGTADVGLWHREKLVRLCVSLPNTFTMRNHPDFDFFPEEQEKFINAAMVRNRTDVVQDIVHPPEQFNYPPENDAGLMDRAHRHIFSDMLHQGSLAVDIRIFDEEFFRDVKKGNEDSIAEEGSDLVKAWNNTPSSISMQSHMLRHDGRRGTVSFNVQNIVDADRSDFPPQGPIEKDSEEFLRAAQEGNLSRVNELLNSDRVYVDVRDMNGHTALLGASVNWHQLIINSLLDNGADVNRLNNEGISALAACHVYFYPSDYFRYNIAERYLEKPKNFETEKGFDVNEVVKGLVPPSSPKRRPTLSTAERQKPPIDTKKIQKLRQEYNLISIEEDADGQLGSAEEDKENAMEDMFLEEEEAADRTLGTLQVKRASKINLEEMLVTHPRMNDDLMKRMSVRKSHDTDDDNFDAYSETEMSDFESVKSIRNMPIDVSDQLIERCATHMSQNDMVVGRSRVKDANKESLGTVRRLAMDKSHHDLMETTIRLLLRRGADPNASSVPMPVLFFAIKAADVDAVRLLLLKSASTSSTLSDKRGGLSPLHIAAAIPGEEGVVITELLLNSLACPDARATLDDAFLNRSLRGSFALSSQGGDTGGPNLEELAEMLPKQIFELEEAEEEEWSKDNINPYLKSLSGGRTPLHIACARDDNYRNACRVVHLLLAHHANPNLLCNGHSPLALAIAGGNDLAIDELLAYGADPCLPLTHGVGSALCIASNTDYEHRRTPQARLYLIDKLIRSGADILAPIPIGPKRVTGTAVDYAYYMYNLDRRIAHMPYHALTPAERETFNARRRLLAHMGDILRIKAVERERMRLEEEERMGMRSVSPSHNFTYTGAGAPLPPGIIKGRGQKGASAAGEGRVSFGGALMAPSALDGSEAETRKPLFRYCYECGRSVGVRLSACTRCKEVYYCSKACKLKAWNARHKEECIRVGGRSRSSSPNRGGANRIDSPTPATDPDLGNPTTVAGISGHHHGQRIKGEKPGQKKHSKRQTGGEDDSYDSTENQALGKAHQKRETHRESSDVGDSIEEPGRHRGVNQRKLWSANDPEKMLPGKHPSNEHRRKPRHQNNDSRLNEEADGRQGQRYTRKAWAEEDEYNDNYSSTYGKGPRSQHSKQRARAKRTEYNKLNLGLSEDEDEDDLGARHQPRRNRHGDYDNDNGADGWAGERASRKYSNKSKKRSGTGDGSEEADWMSPRRRTDKRRPRTENDWLPAARNDSKSKKDKSDKPGRRWAKAPAETDVTPVSMLNPKVPKVRNASNKKSAIVKLYQLPPIAESPTGVARYATVIPKMEKHYSKGHSHGQTHAQGHMQLTGPPPRSLTDPGPGGNVRPMAKVKMHMKISIRPKRSYGGKSLPDMFSSQLPALAAPQGTKVPIKGRSHSAQPVGQKGGRGKSSLFPQLNNKKAQTFHGLTSTKYALTIMPHLKGTVDMQHYKYIYLDNYSFN